jgi:hypothetical protein
MENYFEESNRSTLILVQKNLEQLKIQVMVMVYSLS